MYILSVLLTIVEVVVCLMLIGLVLIQRSKGEGLSVAFGGGMGESIFGGNVGSVVTRATVVLGLVFLVNTIVLTLVMSKARSGRIGSVMDEVPRAPVSAPAQPGPAAPAPTTP
jgi:preprotein translocase subunit SecG